MWTTIYMSQKAEEAKKVQETLFEEGIIAKNKRVCNEASDGYCYEILVPSKEVAAAHSIIIDIEL